MEIDAHPAGRLHTQSHLAVAAIVKTSPPPPLPPLYGGVLVCGPRDSADLSPRTPAPAGAGIHPADASRIFRCAAYWVEQKKSRKPLRGSTNTEMKKIG